MNRSLLDWTLQMAYRNFSGALFHFGGQNAAYNGTFRLTMLTQPVLASSGH